MSQLWGRQTGPRRSPVVHEAMDYIWQAFGKDSCWLFDEHGQLSKTP
jgi:hypothetical protein